MSWLTLVRHAQASFHADHYDQLSELGQRQAKIIGESWVQARREVDQVYVGPRQRQRQTVELVANRYRDAGLQFPEPIMLPELDEYDLGGLLRKLAPELVRKSTEFANLWAVVREGVTHQDRERSFQNAFEPLMHHWLTADTALDGLESWPMFHDRVQRALRGIVDQPGKKRRVIAVTSGGFIGTAVQMVMEAPDRMALELNWRVRNGAETDFVFSRERITLDRFNSVAHFEPELVTYR